MKEQKNARERAADTRDQLADERDAVADRRDAAADARDARNVGWRAKVDRLLTRALRRDAAAERRDEQAKSRDQAAAVQLLGTPCADEAALDRGLAGVLRMWSGMDRDASASDREELVDAMKDLDRAPDRRPPSDT